MISVPTAKGEKKMRLIDAHFVFEQIEKEKKDIVVPNPYSKCKNSEYDIGYNNALTMAKSIAKKAPTIKAEPVRNGEYVLLYDTYGPMVCSECGGEAPSILMGSEYEESRYCPSCGAKMDGKEKME